MDILRLSLHVVAATIWVGGQLTLAALVPVLRRVAPEATKAVARQFRRIAWPAFAVLVLTGGWNVAAQDSEHHGGGALLGVKMLAVVLSGVSAFLHERATSRRGLAVWGALSFVTALAALVLGVSLSESS